jgi:hypothetical protein
MIRRTVQLAMFAGGAVLGPLPALGHGCEFLLARVEAREGWVRLEITADPVGNPLLADEAAAVAALRGSLQVRTGAGLRPLAELAPVRVETRDRWDPEAPSFQSPPAADEPHRLLTAVWEWRPPAEEVAFAVPRGNLHDVLLWRPARGEPALWRLLIEGETGPAIVVPRAAGFPIGWLLFGLVFAGLAAGWIKYRGGCRRVPGAGAD